MTCYYQSHPGERGYRHGLDAFWAEKGLFEVGEHRFYDQVKMIRKKGCLSQLQLKEISRLMESGKNNAEAQQEGQN